MWGPTLHLCHPAWLPTPIHRSSMSGTPNSCCKTMSLGTSKWMQMDVECALWKAINALTVSGQNKWWPSVSLPEHMSKKFIENSWGWGHGALLQRPSTPEEWSFSCAKPKYPKGALLQSPKLHLEPAALTSMFTSELLLAPTTYTNSSKVAANSFWNWSRNLQILIGTFQ